MQLKAILLSFKIIGLVFIFSAAQAATLTATPDRTVIGEDETVQLSVRIDEQVGYGGPDFSLLEEHFDILNQHKSNQFRSINGRTEGWTEWNIILAPKKAGQLIIPSFNYEGAISNAVQITVNSAAADPQGTVKDMFVEMEVDKNNIYVQEQLLVTYRIFSAVQVREISLANALTIEDANVEVVAEASYTKRIQDQTYRASEITYAIHPQKSEAITIPSLTWNLVAAAGSRATWFNDPFRANRGQMRRLRTEARTIPVNPRPSNYSGQDWIPASSVELEQHWSSDPSRFVVGEPITRTLTLTAQGLGSSQLPAIPMTEGMGFKTYSDQPQFDETKSAQGLTGIRIETSAIVPTQAGELIIEPVEVSWWDTKNNRQRITTLPAKVVNVSPASVSGQIQTPPLPAPVPNIDETAVSNVTNDSIEGMLVPANWPLLASNIFFAMLSVLFFMAWLKTKQQTPKADSVGDEKLELKIGQHFQNVRRACADNQAQACKQALGLWAQNFWNLSHIASLEEIKQFSQDQNLAKELENLNHILYGNEQDQNQWKGEGLWQALINYKKKAKVKPGNTTSSLKPLYPNAA